MTNFACRSPGRAGEIRYRRPHPRRRTLKADPQPGWLRTGAYTRLFPARHKLRAVPAAHAVSPEVLSSFAGHDNVVTVDYPFQGSFITLEIVPGANGRAKL